MNIKNSEVVKFCRQNAILITVSLLQITTIYFDSDFQNIKFSCCGLKAGSFILNRFIKPHYPLSLKLKKLWN